MIRRSEGKDWEEELFLHDHDVANLRAKQTMQAIVDDIEGDIEGGSMDNTSDAVLQRLRRELQTLSEGLAAVRDPKASEIVELSAPHAQPMAAVTSKEAE